MAIVVALLSMLLMSALGAALVVTTSSDSLIAGNFRTGIEGRYAADAALERTLDELAALPDWNPLLGGLVQSPFVDGPPAGRRTLDDGTTIDLDRVLHMANCRKTSPCSATDRTAVTSARPWGANNPNWQLFAFGPLKDLMSGAIKSNQYVVVLVADDPSENDDDPLRDGSDETNPGAGVVVLRAEAFGPRGSHQVVEVTVMRASEGPPGIRVVSWRAPRRS
jgi:hypothetical protein